jgi:hypothetical protein
MIKRKERKKGEKTKEGTRNKLQINNIGILFYLTTVASCCLSTLLHNKTLTYSIHFYQM